jgi:tetratricopeptide (TPR) repeat protein
MGNRRAQALFLFWLGTVTAGAAQGPAADPLSPVRALYDSAQYDDALTLIHSSESEDMTALHHRERSMYRALCHLALNRRDEAAAAIEEMVTADPLYVPPDAGTPPRFRALFADVRGRLVPAIAKRQYEAAKQLFDTSQYDQAVEAFTLVLRLAEQEGGATGDLKDVTTLANGFRDLSRRLGHTEKATTAARDVAPPATTTSTPRPAAATSASAAAADSTAEIIPPVALQQHLPPVPLELVRRGVRPNAQGVLQIVVDTAGQVKSAILVQRIHPSYDPLVVAAAKDWKFQPAMKDGKPVEYVKRITVNVALND